MGFLSAILDLVVQLLIMVKRGHNIWISSSIHSAEILFYHMGDATTLKLINEYFLVQNFFKNCSKNLPLD